MGWGDFGCDGDMKQLNKCKEKEGWFAIFNHPPYIQKPSIHAAFQNLRTSVISSQVSISWPAGSAGHNICTLVHMFIYTYVLYTYCRFVSCDKYITFLIVSKRY